MFTELTNALAYFATGLITDVKTVSLGKVWPGANTPTYLSGDAATSEVKFYFVDFRR
jgi:hypothetical protein